MLRSEVESQCQVEVSLMDNWARGSYGAVDLANKVVAICDKSNNEINYTYELNDSVKEKIEKVATKIYGAENIEYTEEAEEEIKKIQEDSEANNKPICIAKTQYSFSDDPKNLSCDKPFTIHITSAEYKAGAEFIVVKTGNVMTMPGLPKVPAAEKIDVDENGNIVGIF